MLALCVMELSMLASPSVEFGQNNSVCRANIGVTESSVRETQAGECKQARNLYNGKFCAEILMLGAFSRPRTEATAKFFERLE